MAACSTCGLEVQAGARFCGNCGGPVVGAVPEPREEITAELAPGTRLDERYEILKTLGRGGMGVVYLARDQERDGSLLALKLLPAELTADPHGLALLKQEASVAMRLSHPNIVRLHNLEGRSRKYVTMEYVDGGSLADLLMARMRGEHPRPPSWSGAGLSPSEVIPLLDGIAAGLDHAHSERVIHRDMKPANVLIKRRGDVLVPKVADFGIAREIRDMVSRVTQNVVAGTPSYMSPEHYRGERLDARADVYSVAATVYTLLAARPPFKGGELSWQIMNKEPDPIHGVPPAVFAVVRRGMAKDQRARPDSCGALAAEFRAAVAAAELVADTSNPDQATVSPPEPTTSSPPTPAVTAPSPPAAPPADAGDTPTTRPAELAKIDDDATVKPPPGDRIPVPDVKPPAPPPVAPALPATPRGSPVLVGVALVAVACVAVWRASDGPALRPTATPSAVASASPSISDLIHDRKLSEARALLFSRATLTEEDVNDGLGLGLAYLRQDEAKAAETIWAFVVERLPKAAEGLARTVDELKKAGHPRSRQALEIAVRIVPDGAWAREARDELAGKPSASKALAAAREAHDRGDYESVARELTPLDLDAYPDAAVLLCEALDRAGKTGPARAMLEKADGARQRLSIDSLRKLHELAMSFERWDTAQHAGDEWVRKTNGGDPAAVEAVARALEGKGNRDAAANLRKKINR